MLPSRVGHAFFSKERNVLAFFCVLYKRTRRSLRSFAVFSFLGLKVIFCNIYLYISIHQYIYIYISINIYLKKEQGLGMRSFQKNATFCVLLQKNVAFFALFYVLCKRTLHSLHSFLFLKKRTQNNAKERCVLSKSAKE